MYNFGPNRLVTPAPVHPMRDRLNELVARAIAEFDRAEVKGYLDGFGDDHADINSLPNLGDLVWRSTSTDECAIYHVHHGRYAVVADWNGPIGTTFDTAPGPVERIYHDL